MVFQDRTAAAICIESFGVVAMSIPVTVRVVQTNQLFSA